MTLDSSSIPTDDRANARQLAVVALCVVALLAAALALPPVSGLPPAPGTGGTDGDGGGGDNGGGGGTDGPGVIQSGNATGTPTEAPEEVDGTLDRECAVYLLDRPVPGSVVTVLVLRDQTRNAGAPVRFNGEFVGETNDAGMVSGEVPYERELQVTVETEDGVGCAFVDHRGDVRESAVAAGLAAGGAVAAQADTPESGNYSVEGSVQIGIRGEPYPGDEVRVLAAIDGVPMRQAAVEIDGEQVTRTDSGGTATVTLPDDGRESIAVDASRGDFSGSRTVDLLTLQIQVRPNTLVGIPGGTATARATIDGAPVPDAPMTLDGESIGRTNELGQVQFTLPADPTSTLSVSARDQQASTSLWPVYVPSITIVLTYLGILAVAYWRDGVRGAVGVLAATGVLGGLFLSLYGLVRGLPPLLAGGTLLVLAGIGILFWQRDHWRAAASQGADDFGGFVASLVRATVAFVYEAALALERVVVWAGTRLRGFVERVKSMPRSLSGIATAVAAWIAALPGRIVDAVHWVVGAPWRLLAWWRARGAEGTDGDTEAAERTRTMPSRFEEGETSFSLREAWRRFARWVVPGRWRRRTPGEVARSADSEGFPREAVAQLTGVFRDVEYGERPLTEERRERAEEAFEALEGHRRRGDEEAGD